MIPLYVAGNVWYTAKNSTAEKSDVILVMGAAQFDGRPSEVLLARLDQAKSTFKSGLAPRIYTIGGGAPGDRTTEAAASRTWLINNGISKKNILVIHTNSENIIEHEELDVIEERIYGVSKIYFAKLNLT